MTTAILVRKTLSQERDADFNILPGDVKTSHMIAHYTIAQCLVVFILGATVFQCVWAVEDATSDFDILVRVMYLYDADSCHIKKAKDSKIAELKLSDDNHGYNVLPIQKTSPISMISTNLADKTRRYIAFSIAIHVFWLVQSIAVRIFITTTGKMKHMKRILTTYYCSYIFMCIFDVSMGIVYIAHIQQALTKAMIIQYSGWVNIKIKSPNEFAGWLPLYASCCWMRGIIFLSLNIYCCNQLSILRSKIFKREVKRRLMDKGNLPIPDSQFDNVDEKGKALFYRAGEETPFLKKGRFYETS